MKYFDEQGNNQSNCKYTGQQELVQYNRGTGALLSNNCIIGEPEHQDYPVIIEITITTLTRIYSYTNSQFFFDSFFQTGYLGA